MPHHDRAQALLATAAPRAGRAFRQAAAEVDDGKVEFQCLDVGDAHPLDVVMPLHVDAFPEVRRLPPDAPILPGQVIADNGPQGWTATAP
jgi:hypothetical protein